MTAIPGMLETIKYIDSLDEGNVENLTRFFFFCSLNGLRSSVIPDLPAYVQCLHHIFSGEYLITRYRAHGITGATLDYVTSIDDPELRSIVFAALRGTHAWYHVSGSEVRFELLQHAQMLESAFRGQTRFLLHCLTGGTIEEEWV